MSAERAWDELCHEMAADPSVSEAKWFGIPALKVGSKVFAGFWQGEHLVAKIGAPRVTELAEAGSAVAFDPSGKDRAMKDWAQVAFGAGDWTALGDEARGLVASL